MSRVTDPEHKKSVITVAFYCLEFLLFCHIVSNFDINNKKQIVSDI